MPGQYSISVTGAISVLLLASILYCAGLLVYRLVLHPLSKYPGSKLAAATTWYEFYFDILHGQGGTFVYEIDRMHEIYGPIIRVTPDELHIKDPPFYGSLYGSAGSIRDRYPPTARIVGTPQGTFGTVHHHVHRPRRAALASLFSKATVSSYHHIVRKHADRLANSLRQNSDSHGFVELRTLYIAFSTDVICEYSFGNPWDLLLDQKRATEWRTSVNALVSFTPYARHFGWILPISKTLPSRLISRFSPEMGLQIRIFEESNARAAAAIREFNARTNAKEFVDDWSEKGQKNSQPSTIYQQILASKLPPTEKAIQRMGDEGVVVIAAGSDTVARTMTATTFHLLDNPEVLHLLKKELLDVMPDPDIIPHMKQLEQLPYLTAIIKESLRITGNLTSRLSIISPGQPVQYKEWSIPAGTAIGMTPHKTLNDPTIFPDPNQYRPERWLASKEEVQRLEQCFVPFGKGNRICLGMNLAYAELYTAIATLFRRFELELVDVVRERDVDPVRDFFVGEPSLESTGVRVKVKAMV